MKNKVVVFTQPGKAIIEEVSLTKMGPSDVLVETEYSTISVGTERWILNGILRGCGFPFVPGYQSAGTVIEMGTEVKDLRLGDRVFSSGCRMPEDFKGGWWGGHCQYHVINHKSIVNYRNDKISAIAASGLLVAQVGYNGASKPRINKGDVALIIGDGMVGQFAGQVLKSRGAYVIMAGLHKNRLDMAKKFFADEVINSYEVDLEGYIKSKYPNGIQVAVEAASKISMVEKAVSMLQYEGQMVVLGYYTEKECMLDIHWVRETETTVYFPNSSNRDRLIKTLELVEKGLIRIEEMNTHEFSYTQASEAYEMINDKSKATEYMGVVLNWKK